MALAAAADDVCGLRSKMLEGASLKHYHYNSASSLAFYLQAPLLSANDREGAVSSVHSQAVDELLKLVDWSCFDEACRLSGAEHLVNDERLWPAASLHSCQLWAGHGGGSSTPCHFDARHNLLAQLLGSKQVFIVPPCHSFDLYPVAVGEARDNYMQAQLDEPDLNRFPALSRVRVLQATLSEGDVLWLPRYWWHLVRQCDESSENVSLSFWLGGLGNEEFRATCERSAEVVDRTSGCASTEVDAELEDLEFRRSLEQDGQFALLAFKTGRFAEEVACRVCGTNSLGGEFLTALATRDDEGGKYDQKQQKSLGAFVHSSQPFLGQ
eukprot:CAMPEP_0119304332 /NCGR_PEP_ID=MMETSP1333-20130426/5577_1 /TAXON_ID=418940 /ORGANISM="Scyphosphaera apsteinii, Strain RCC1455" /LENGTH=324 /DNA_ID=CAMNT_0007307189 /DNA_START=351 /DNA_END=1328 /DNA_ORIENTATION=+